MVCGSEEIKKTIEKHLGISEGETTEDGLFTLREVECLGSCANAPMVQLNDDYYECLTPKTTIALLEACKQGRPPAMGKWGSLPMNGQVFIIRYNTFGCFIISLSQVSCEGPLGKTSLFTAPSAIDFKATFRTDELVPKVACFHFEFVHNTHPLLLIGQPCRRQSAHEILIALSICSFLSTASIFCFKFKENFHYTVSLLG